MDMKSLVGCEERSMQKQFYLCVNYNSSSTLARTIPNWLALNPEIDIIIIDNFSSDAELRDIYDLAAKHNCQVLESDNIGYGPALNIGLDFIKNKCDEAADVCIFFGNCDVKPQFINEYVAPGVLPEITVYTKGKNSNPFLTKAQMKFLKLLFWSAKYESITIKAIWSVINKIVRYIPSRTAAVHGSIMAINLKSLRKLPKLFCDEIFLYQEEIFFAHVIASSHMKIEKSSLHFVHEGSVSTAGTVKKDIKSYFKLWCRSTIACFNAIERYQRGMQ